jgi:hypothetical protein
MKEPGLDKRHRDQDGKIHLKNGNALNKNLAQPIQGFSPQAKVETMRKVTGEKSLAGIRAAAKGRK